jgi:hypothetical protein
MSFVSSLCMYFMYFLFHFHYLLFKLDSQRPRIHLVILLAEVV